MWLKDPKDDKPSVSLTLLVLSCIVLLIVGLLDCFGIIKSTSIFLEFTMSLIALYFGRRLTFKGQVFGDSEEKEKSTND